jgi:maltooligosyltrehalose trehalohydrolase
MGEEWAESAPFLYFTSHTDVELGRAVRRGRMEEYDSFVRGEGETESTLGGFSDPQSEITFVRSKLDWELLTKSPHAETLTFYRDALAVRRATPALSNCDKTRTRVSFDEDGRRLTIERGDASGSRAALLCNLSADAQAFTIPEGDWRLALWTGDAKYGGDTTHPAPPDEPDARAEIELAAWGAALYINDERGMMNDE